LNKTDFLLRSSNTLLPVTLDNASDYRTNRLYRTVR